MGRVGLGEGNKNFLPTGSRPKKSNKIILQLCWVRRGGESPTYPVPTQKVQQTVIEVGFWVGSKMQENDQVGLKEAKNFYLPDPGPKDTMKLFCSSVMLG